MILIDKPIPEDCDDCFCNDDNYRCGLLNEEFPLHLSGRLPNCLLREMEKADDIISRQAAIEALEEEKYPCETDYDEGFMASLDKAIWIVGKWLPSAQPEPLTVNFAREMDRETIEKLKEGLKNAPVLIMAVNDSARPEPQWIPCNWHKDTENLPDECKSVLICIKDKIGTYVDVSYRTDYNRWERYGRNINVVAWMPLPEPWKGENDAQQDCP